MASVNKVILIGHLGRDPEVRYSASGDAVCNLSLATSQQWKDKDTGQRREETEWHRVVLYRRQAEIAGEYLKKGSLAYIEGHLKTRKWTDRENIERFTTEIQGDKLTLLGGRDANNGTAPPAAAPSSTATAASYRAAKDGSAAPAPTHSSGGGLADMDDDIPF